MRDIAGRLNLLKETPSANMKVSMLRNCVEQIPYFDKVVRYALDPFKHFNIVKIQFMVDFETRDGNGDYDDIFEFLDYMNGKNGATAEDVAKMSQLASRTRETYSVVCAILAKDLKCGVAIKTANKVLEPKIPEYEVMKAVHDSPFPGSEWAKFCALCTEGVCLRSIKADGYRISYAEVHEDLSVVYLSTAGKPYENFHMFDETLVAIAKDLNETYHWQYPIKFDGEAVPMDGDFQTMQKQGRRKSGIDPEIPRFLVWDVFNDDTSEWPYTDRLDTLEHYQLPRTSGRIEEQVEIFQNMPQYKVFLLAHDIIPVPSAAEATEMALDAISRGNEGLVFKTPNHQHELRRMRDWFKIKALYLKGTGIEIDLPVVGFNYGRKGTKYESMLGAFVCEYKGQHVNVSGKMTDGDRRRFVENLPPFIEVHADSETNDGSLRIPIYQRPRYDK